MNTTTAYKDLYELTTFNIGEGLDSVTINGQTYMRKSNRQGQWLISYKSRAVTVNKLYTEMTGNTLPNNYAGGMRRATEREAFEHALTLYSVDLETGHVTRDNKEIPYKTNALGHQMITVYPENCRGYNVYVHRLIMYILHSDIPAGLVCDHINRNPRDNRACNIRLLTHTQNNLNKANIRPDGTFVGVYRNKSGTYTAKLGRENLGTFSTEYEANTVRTDAVAEALSITPTSY